MTKMFSIGYSLKRNIIINKPLEVIFETISNFETWAHWSPWLCQEKDCSVEVSGTPNRKEHSQAWNGKRIGQGSMTLKYIFDQKMLVFRLNILKPWKSKARVKFIFNETPDGVEVSWTLVSVLPFYLFFMKKMMIALISSDYDRGLLMLKEYLENGVVPTETTYTGEVTKEGFYYLGKRKKSSIADMPKIMEADFKELNELIDSGKVEKPQEVISFYHKFDLVKGKCEFTSALTFKNEPKSTLELSAGEIAPHKCVQVVHTGPYRHLGNAWTAVMVAQRAEKLKADKSVPWYELYINSPQKVSENDLKTEINIPIK